MGNEVLHNVMLHLSDQPGNINKDLSDSDEISLVNSCSCKCNSLAVDIEELKLDKVVLESRMGHKFENLEKKAKADEAMNIHANIILSHKTTHADNKRVTSNLVVNDIEQISFVSPVDDSNRKVADSLVNESQKIDVDHNTYQNSTTSTNKREKKETHQLDDELDQIQIEASTLLRQDAKNHQHNANHMANDTVQIHKNFVNIGELEVQKHLNKTAYTERPRAVDNTVKGPYRRNHQYNSIPINTINPYVNNNDSAEGSLCQNCPIPTRITDENISKIWVRIPFLGKQGEYLVKKLIRKLQRNLTKPIKFIVIYQTKKVSYFLFKKNKIPDFERNDLVYEFSRSGCSATCIGKTVRNLRTWLTEHAKLNTSAVSEHLRTCEHAKHIADLHNLHDNVNDLNPDKPFSDYELIHNNTKILQLLQHTNSNISLFLEALHIKFKRPALNNGLKVSKELMLFL